MYVVLCVYRVYNVCSTVCILTPVLPSVAAEEDGEETGMRQSELVNWYLTKRKCCHGDVLIYHQEVC